MMSKRKAGSTEERLPNPSPSGETGPRTGLRAPFFGKAKALSCALALVISFLVASMVLAQTGGGYDLSWWTVDGGGATISGGGYTLSGTAGQPEPGPTLSGGDHTLLSGFWPGGGEAPACDVPLTGVSLSGPSSGQAGETLNFTASPQPSNATAPVNYTWSSDGLISGQGTASATYRWTGAGSKSVQVTARNCGQQDFSDSQTVAISTPCPKPVVGVSVTGPGSGYTNADYAFAASVDPGDATTPITYTWSSHGLVSGQDTANATYRWTTTGDHTISVSVENCGGSATDQHTITLSEQPSCPNPIAGVTISGPTSGDTDVDLVFTASVQPSNATTPVDYVWSSDGLVSGQSTASATYRWNQAGDYQITVSASNCGGSKNDSHDIQIGGTYVYLPLVVRNYSE